MNTRRSQMSLLNIACPVIALGILTCAKAADVKLVRVPDGGIQPQAMTDGKGALHLIYFKGEPKAGDIFHAHREAGRDAFSQPMRVNSEPGSAVAIGTIRGGQIAIGRNGRAHVVWNGTKSRPGAKYKGAPMWYARLNETGTAFEPQRDLITFAGGLDGGGAVAADDGGNVHVFWHGAAPDNSTGEAGRAVFIARSTDDGKTFSAEKQANPKPTGACGCCGMRALADPSGNVYALYRAATAMVNRDEVLLISRDRGVTFEMAGTHPWNIASCPMSSASLAVSKTGVVAAWETAGQVYFAMANAGTLSVGVPVSPPGVAKRKHPVAVTNAKGELLLAWTEGTGWKKGGALAWQIFDPSGRPTEQKGRLEDGVPVWSLVAAVAEPDGGFTILH